MVEMLKAGLQTVVVDPVGVCWGLEPLLMEGCRVTDSCAGRDHGDIEIEATSGAVIAEFVVDEGQSAVLVVILAALK